MGGQQIQQWKALGALYDFHTTGSRGPRFSMRRRKCRETGRNQFGSSRRAVPGRVARVHAIGNRSHASTARRRRGHDCTRGRHVLLPGAIHARRLDESVPVRLGRLPSVCPFGAAARPHRSSDRNHTRAVRRDGPARRSGAVGDYPRASPGRARLHVNGSPARRSAQTQTSRRAPCARTVRSTIRQ